LSLFFSRCFFFYFRKFENLWQHFWRRAASITSRLPFDNLSDDPAMDSVVQGLMESMTSELSNLSSVQQSLWVVPASVVRSRKITEDRVCFTGGSRRRYRRATAPDGFGSGQTP
jgi:hypothetical protein